MKIGASHIADLLVSEIFTIPRHVCVANVSFSLLHHEADLLVMTQSGYLIEVEIKVSLSDLKRDAAKSKWNCPRFRRMVSRFYYAMPAPLWEKESAKASVHDGAGVILVEEYRGRLRCRIEREAVRMTAPPLSERDKFALARTGSFRAWSPFQKHRRRQLAADGRLQDRRRQAELEAMLAQRQKNEGF